MTSIGNDIIALKTIDIPRTRNPRFYSKILSVTEHQLYQSQFTAIPFEYFVWLLWSIKEAAYKCLQRHRPGLVFSPTGTAVMQLIAPVVYLNPFTDVLEATGFYNEACFSSKINVDSEIFYARSAIYGDEVITSIAQFDPDFSHISWGLKRITQNDADSQSAGVRDFLLHRLHSLFPNQELSIEKNASGCPLLFVDGKDSDLPVSLSHHDKYVGYAIIG